MLLTLVLLLVGGFTDVESSRLFGNPLLGQVLRNNGLIWRQHLRPTSQNYTAQTLTVGFSRLNAREVSPGEFVDFANTPDDFERLHKAVRLTVCDNPVVSRFMNDAGGADFIWRIFDNGLSGVSLGFNHLCTGIVGTSGVAKVPIGSKITTQNCSLECRVAREGSYTVEVVMMQDDKVLGKGSKRVEIRDVWFVVMGDSLASGQGNPDVNASVATGEPAKWILDQCYRSSLSFSYIIYENIRRKYPNHGVLFTYLACSGASVNTGLKGLHVGQDPQLVVVSSLMSAARDNCPCDTCCKITPDIVQLNVGANDIEFGTLFESIVSGQIGSQLARLPELRDQFRVSLNWLAGRITSLGIPSNRIFFIEYPQGLRNTAGEFDISCILEKVPADLISTIDSEFGVALNNIILDVSLANKWTYVDGIYEAYNTHGLCSEVPYMRNIEESLELQGDLFGVGHPNRLGHEVIAELVWDRMMNKIDGVLRQGQKQMYRAWHRYFMDV